jgi:hypothetical protein
MTDNIIRAWVLATDPDFGGSLDSDPDVLRKVGRQQRIPKSGVPYCYRSAKGYQVKIPDMPSKFFKELDDARTFVSLHVQIEEQP